MNKKLWYNQNEAGHINQEATITLKDNGQGIEDAYKEKIFAMFFRASERTDGSGLGLYIVKQAIERMGERLCL
ncbi:sensor histidine kinase [Xanthocytophaga flava]|nr:ATP-binding protein [Xanthocytophaga flavus]MDJ1469903.1 ATP-binding protein [Xanthocytophaga flavus]